MGANTGLTLIENYLAISIRRLGLFWHQRQKPKKSNAVSEMRGPGSQFPCLTDGKTEAMRWMAYPGWHMRELGMSELQNRYHNVLPGPSPLISTHPFPQGNKELTEQSQAVTTWVAMHSVYRFVEFYSKWLQENMWPPGSRETSLRPQMSSDSDGSW